MQQRDYILRMIEELGAALTRLRQMILGGSVSAEDAHLDLETAARQLGIDLDGARLVSVDTLVMMMSPGGSPDTSRCLVVAELLYLDALASELAGEHAAARDGFEKAVRLYGMVPPEATLMDGGADASERLAEILAKTGDGPEGRDG